ncbi:hypothetical protein [Arenimonas oryziterrae]|uniref:Uncharacterized protein n=1 Tax=Arenimonas oryziterrae DSM 21050 = YC6267 TaxID=1121015 RepID=A0A091AT97_9GAMM|nr:hypothetical protein [Arenimonas oryziterrae]KFN42576.1 hypothetical protein N789_13125 [Arenimonas oryziterrae DSM 21050 = YC6267]
MSTNPNPPILRYQTLELEPLDGEAPKPVTGRANFHPNTRDAHDRRQLEDRRQELRFQNDRRSKKDRRPRRTWENGSNL